MIKYICIFRLVLRCLLDARKENLTGVSTGLTGQSKNLDPTSNPTGRSTQPVSLSERHCFQYGFGKFYQDRVYFGWDAVLQNSTLKTLFLSD